MTSALIPGSGDALTLPPPDAADLQQLLGWLDAQQQRERDDLAAALHDQLGSSLTALAMRLAMIARKTASDDPQLTALWDKANSQLSAISATARLVQKQLRPVALEALGLEPALRDYLMKFGLRAELACTLRFEPDLAALPLAQAAVVFKIIEAALANVEQHAQARHVVLSVAHAAAGQGWQLVLEDDGAGFDTTAIVLRATQGLRLMQVRAASIGMTLTLNSAPGHGCRIGLQSVPGHLP